MLKECRCHVVLNYRWFLIVCHAVLSTPVLSFQPTPVVSTMESSTAGVRPPAPALAAKRAQDTDDTPMRTFDIRLHESVNHLSSSLGMPPLFKQFRTSMQYTDEAIGVDYLFRQTG